MSTNTSFGLTSGGLVVNREEVHMPPEYVEMLIAFSKASEHDMRLILRCSMCGQQPAGANAPGDLVLRMVCGCRTFIGANPLVHQ